MVSIALLAYWVDPADDDKILGTFREALDKIDKEAVSCRTQQVREVQISQLFIPLPGPDRLLRTREQTAVAEGEYEIRP